MTAVSTNTYLFRSDNQFFSVKGEFPFSPDIEILFEDVMGKKGTVSVDVFSKVYNDILSYHRLPGELGIYQLKEGETWKNRLDTYNSKSDADKRAMIIQFAKEGTLFNPNFFGSVEID